MIFKDRTGTNLNRKRIKIITQTPTEIIADIERADNPTEEGTPINASVFNSFQNELNTANSNASQALSQSSTALNDSSIALATATSVSNSFDQLREGSQMLQITYNTTQAIWAHNDVNTLPTAFGIGGREQSNIVFSCGGTPYCNVIADGHFYGDDGQKKVAYEVDVLKLNGDQQVNGSVTFNQVSASSGMYSNGKQVSTATFTLNGTSLSITN